MSLSSYVLRGDYLANASYSTSDPIADDYYVQFHNEGGDSQAALFYGDSTATSDNNAFALQPGELSVPFYVVGTTNSGSGSYAYRAAGNLAARVIITTL